MSESIGGSGNSVRLNVPSVEVGQPRIVTSSQYIQDLSKDELKMNKRLWTFDTMCLDESVGVSIDVTNLHVLKTLYKGEYKAKTKKGKIAADFLNYNIRNMSYGTWMDAIINMSTDIKYGWSILNTVTEKRQYGKYKNNRCLKKLAPRDQKSLYGWLWDKNRRECLGFIQKPMIKGNINTNKFVGSVYESDVNSMWDYSSFPIIRNNQMLHTKFNTTNNNPQGNSPLVTAYQAWYEKRMLEQYEIVG